MSITPLKWQEKLVVFFLFINSTRDSQNYKKNQKKKKSFI